MDLDQLVESLRNLGRGPLLQRLARALPGVVIVALIVGLLVPLPKAIVDLLLSCSLAGAVGLLVVSARVERSSQFSSLPPLLLVVTLFRLVLNVSTTRLILDKADAGQVIDAFAAVVIRGDMVIGVVMFAIITALQFLVIARGSERVAEVGARFALDALPGQQAAIESELRSGAISPKQASERRALVLERSNFFGRMDGAVRFVRGDALLGLTITAVNLLGGVAMGSLRHDLGLVDSIALYGQLTIGDGLAAQIPALLVSLSAAVLVSRVERESWRESDATAEDMAWSTTGRSDASASFLSWVPIEAVFVPSGFLFVLSSIPGMPTATFVSVASLLMFLAIILLLVRRQLDPVVALTSGLRLTLPRELENLSESLCSAVQGARRRCEIDLRVAMPELELYLVDSARSRRLQPGGDGQKRHSDMLVLSYGPRQLVRLGLDEVLRPTDSAEGAAGPPTFDLDHWVLTSYRALASHAEHFVDLRAVEQGLERVRATRPELVQHALERITPGELLAVSRAWLRERLALPPLRSLLEEVVVVPVSQLGQAKANWAEFLREQMAELWLPQLVESMTGAGQQLTWLRATSDDEAALRSHARLDGSMSSFCGPEPLLLQWREFVQDLRERVGEGSASVIVVQSELRCVLAEILSGLQPRLPVISTTELRRASLETAAQESRWLNLPVWDPFND